MKKSWVMFPVLPGLFIGVFISGFFSFPVNAQDKYEKAPDFLRLELIDLAEKPSNQAGFKLLIYQLLLQNTSDTNCILLKYGGATGHVLTTAEDFAYRSDDVYQGSEKKC